MSYFHHSKTGVQIKKIIACLLLVGLLAGVIQLWMTKPTKVLADSTFKFDEGYGTTSAVNDSNGAVSAGTITGATWKSDELCRKEKCLYFDGSGDKVAFTDDTDLDFTATNTFTIAGWFKHPTIATNPDYLISKHESGTAGGYKVYMDADGDIAFAIDDDGTWGPEYVIGDDQSKNYDDNKWHFFTAVKNGTTGIYLYVDGALIDQDTSLTASGSLANAASFHIGIDADGTNNAWDGFIDEVKVLRTARTATEIASDFLGSAITFTGNGPVGWWRMDESSWTNDCSTDSTMDSSGNGRNGDSCPASTGPTTPVAGKFNNAGDFDGSNDYVSVGDQSIYDFGDNQDFTIAVWVKTNIDPVNDTYPYITVKEGGSPRYGFAILANIAQYGSTWRGEIYVNGTLYSTMGASDITDNQWHHLVLQRSGNSLITYQDGKLASTNDAASSASIANALSLNIGIASDGSSYPLDGQIDDVRMYNYARSPIQVLEDMTGYPPSGLSASFGPDQSYLTNGLVGYWKMDETSGNASDSSGNGYTLTNNNTTTYTAGKYGNSSNHVAASSQYFSCTDASCPLLSPESDSFTVSAWVKLGTKTTQRGIVERGGAFGSNTEYSVSYSQSQDRFRLMLISGGSPTYLDADTFGSPSTGVWYFITAVYDKLAQKAYITVNGQTDSVNYTSTLATSTQDFKIGRSQLSAQYMDGNIDNVRYYNRALSPAEVAKLYSWAPGPVGHWKMDENTGTTANDTSGNNNAGTMTGQMTNTDWRPGKFGSAVNFDDPATDSNNGVQITDTTGSVFDITGPITLSAWVNYTGKASSLMDYAKIIVKADADAVDPYIVYGIGLDNGAAGSQKVKFEITNESPGSLVSVASTTNLPTNIWTFVSGVYDGSKIVIYINGIKEAETATTLTIGTNNQPIDIGRLSYSGLDNYWNGQIDDAKIYNYARTPGQVIEDMNGGHPAPGSPVGSSVAYWKFDEGALNTCSGGADDYCDSSINANNLAFTGTGGFTNSGKFGKAYDGGDNERATRSDDADFDFANGTDDFTLSAWFNRGGAISNQEYLLDKHATNDGYTLYMDSDGDIVCGIGDGTSFPEDTAGTSAANYDDTSWHHAVCVKTGTSSLKLYIDGREVASDTSIAADADMSNSGKLIIADTNETDGTDEFLGDIDEVKIFRSALTLDAIKVLYNQSAGQSLGALSTDSTSLASNSDTDSYCPPGQGSTCTPPVAYWKLDENTGTTIYDSSGNARTGTLTNFPTQAYIPGKFGSAISYDGTDSAPILTTGSYFGSFVSDTTFTVNLWFFAPNAVDATNLITDGSGVYPSDWQIYMNSNGTLSLGWRDSSSVRCDITTTNSYEDSKWHMLTFVRNSGTDTRFYIDTIQDGSCTNNIGSLTTTNSSFGTTSSNTWHGSLDEIRFYDYARSVSQMAWDYNYGKPIGWWKMDESSWTNDCSTDTVKDASGNAIHGDSCPSSTGPVGGATGKFNNGGDFDGSDDRVDIANASKIDLNEGLQNGFTASAWIYPDTDGEGDTGRIFDKGTNTYCKLGSESGGQATISCRVDLTTDAEFSATTKVTIGAWNHVAFSWTNDADDEVTIWVNGTANATASDTFAGDAAADTTALTIGNVAAGSATFDGKIDDFRVYNYEATAQQIKTIMGEGAVRFGPLTGSP